jgi:hypothetical protein
MKRKLKWKRSENCKAQKDKVKIWEKSIKNEKKFLAVFLFFKSILIFILLLSVAKSEVKRSKKRLFHFALKQNEKNLKQNEAKIKIIGSESKRKMLISFRFEAKQKSRSETKK